MISFKHKGNFSKLTNYFEKVKNVLHVGLLDKYGKRGVEALASVTPSESGKTAQSWYYDVKHTKGRVTLSFYNSNIQNGVPIAIILQYGHATRNGGWVEGRDYINSTIQPIFDEIVKEAWKEVKKL